VSWFGVHCSAQAELPCIKRGRKEPSLPGRCLAELPPEPIEGGQQTLPKHFDKSPSDRPQGGAAQDRHELFWSLDGKPL
jgi:hypothetical protein